MVGAKNALEGGTATGYSAIWLGRAVKQAGGRMTALEVDLGRAEIARRNLASCGLQDTVTVVNQDAFEFLAKDRSSYDVVFLDILRGLDPEGIGRLLELVLPRLKIGGLLLGDNALHGGDALDPKSPSAAGLAEFNRRIFSNANLVSSLVPLRDGVAISLKVG